jgi:tetratricopeptide (TPR) repeat protein/predicted aspartyl protease
MKSLTAALMLSLVATVAQAGCLLGKLAELPVTMSDLRPTVHARIKGQDVRFLADSGAFYSVIAPGVAAELKLETYPAPFGMTMGGVGGLASVSLTKVKDFKLDVYQLPNAEFIVGGSETGSGLAGLIGRNLLSYADTEYDLAAGVMRLIRPSGCGGRMLAYWPGGKAYNVVDFMPSDGGKLASADIPVVINGVRLRATLDTGAAGSVVFASAARRAGLTIDQAIERGVSGGIGRRRVGAIVVPVDSIKIGDEEIKHTRIQVLDTSAQILKTDMLLGADFFLSHHVYIAKSQQKVYFTYGGGPVFNLVATNIDSAPATSLPADTAAAPKPDAQPGDAKPPTGEPVDAAGFSRRGEAEEARHDYAKALPDLDRAVSLAPDNADYLYQRALARLHAGQSFLAMADLDLTLKLRPADAPARLTRAELRFFGHDKKGGLEDLDEIAREVVPAADIRLPVGFLYEREGRPDDALKAFDLWIPVHPDDRRRAEALNGRCWSRALLNRDLDKAMADCDAAHRLEPKVGAYLDSRGLVHLRRGEFDKAIADYDLAVPLPPKSAWSLYGRGLAKLKSGDAAGGKADLAAAAAINPKIAEEAAKYGLAPPT